MFTRILKGGVAAAVAGAAMLAISASSASAFSLSSPSLEQPMAASNIDNVWCCHHWGWGGGWGWHPHYWGGGWGWHPHYWGGGPWVGPGWRHCWWNPYGVRVCNW